MNESQNTTSTSPANDRQVGGAHYKGVGYQHWDFSADARLGYFEGQITKYLSRHTKKKGLEDVLKAGHFTDKLLELYKAGQYPMNNSATPGMVTRFCDANELGGNERIAVRLIAFWRSAGQLMDCRDRIAEIAAGYAPKVQEGAK